MPVMDGITFVKEVKKLPNYRFMPIIMLTTESRESRKSEVKWQAPKHGGQTPSVRNRSLQAVAKLIVA